MAIPSPLFNCQQATLLMERQADEVLPTRTRVQLWTHLRWCPLCRRYAWQSSFLVRQAQAAATHVPATTVLPAAARRRLQALLDAHPR